MPGNQIDLISSYSEVRSPFVDVPWTSAKLGEHLPMLHNENTKVVGIPDCEVGRYVGLC